MMPLSVEILVFGSLALYTLACYYTAFKGVDMESFKQPGIMVLFLGLFSFFYSWISFAAWISNLFYFSCFLILFEFPDFIFLGFFFALIALGLSFFALKIDTMLINEAGHTAKVKTGLGFNLWVLSYFFMVMGTGIFWILKFVYSA